MQIKADRSSVCDFRFDDFELLNYQCHSAIAAPVAV